MPIVKSIFDISDEALGEITNYVAQSGLNIPISNILGFQQFTAQTAPFIATAETTASAAYTNLATVGPTLSNLPMGKYIVFFGCVGNNTGVNQTYMSVQVNSTAAVDADSCELSLASHASMMIVVAKTLALDNNTLTAKYRVAAGTGNYFNRWMLAFRYANR